MKRYSILVNAQLNNCAVDMALYSESVDFCQFDESWTFLQWLEKNFPLIEWTPDDGDDFDEDECTTYCQYVSYCDPYNPTSYILASYNETEEDA